MRKIPFGLALIATVLVLILSLLPANNFTDAPRHTDKVVHVFMYFSLAILWLWALGAKWSTFKAKIWIVSSVIMFGILIEVLQKEITAYRSFDLYDIVANTFGAIMAYFLSGFLVKRLNKYFICIFSK